MSFSILGSVKEVLFGKSENGSPVTDGNLRAFFVLEGTNADGNYVFVSKNDLPGRSVLCSDGSFYFIRMIDPSDKDSLDESDKRSFFSVRYFVNKEELDLLKKDIANKEEEVEKLLKKKKDLEELIESLRKENEELAAQPKEKRIIETLESVEMKENPVYVESVSAFSGKEEALEKVKETYQNTRQIFLDYEVTGLDENHEKELADIVINAITQNVPNAQIEKIIDIFMQGQKTGDAETYLRLAAYVTCVETIRQHSSEMKNVSNRKEINRKFMSACAEKLKEYVGDSEYFQLLYETRLQILEDVIKPIKTEYSEKIDKFIQQSNPGISMQP